MAVAGKLLATCTKASFTYIAIDIRNRSQLFSRFVRAATIHLIFFPYFSNIVFFPLSVTWLLHYILARYAQLTGPCPRTHVNTHTHTHTHTLRKTEGERESLYPDRSSSERKEPYFVLFCFFTSSLPLLLYYYLRHTTYEKVVVLFPIAVLFLFLLWLRFGSPFIYLCFMALFRRIPDWRWVWMTGAGESTGIHVPCAYPAWSVDDQERLNARVLYG